MQVNSLHTAAIATLFAALVSGCATVNQEPAQPEAKVTHTVPIVPVRACGSLTHFIEDVSSLSAERLEMLRDELDGYNSDGFSCDRLKTGLLLGQTGLSVSDDNTAIEILEELQGSERLQNDEQRLVGMLLYQTLQRKDLHIKVHNQRQQIRRQEEALAESQIQADARAGEISALQHQLDELKKLEEDINATEQSLSTPATTDIENAEATNTDS